MEYTIAEFKAVCGFNVEPVYYGILQSDATYIEVQFIDKQNEGVLAVSKSNGTIYPIETEHKKVLDLRLGDKVKLTIAVPTNN